VLKDIPRYPVILNTSWWRGSASLPTPDPAPTIRPPRPGMCMLSYMVRVITPATTSSSVRVNFWWRQSGVWQGWRGSSLVGNTTETQEQGCLPFLSDDSVTLFPSVDYSSDGATQMVYEAQYVLMLIDPDLVPA
jgi:hypothetical protein